MALPWLDRLKKRVERKPIVILNLAEGDWARLLESRRGVSEFTIARSRDVLHGISGGTPCLLHSLGPGGELHFGAIRTRTPVSTLESRLKISRATAIQPQSLSECLSLASERGGGRGVDLEPRGDVEIEAITPRLSILLLDALASIDGNHDAIRAVETELSASKRFGGVPQLQEDAVRTALAAFGLTIDDRADSLLLVPGKKTALSRLPLREDAVIQHDARQIPGFDLVESDLTGRAVFQRGGERLEVFTANKLALEETFGVDLIYFNIPRRSVVMVQYKMLELEPTDGSEPDWIYRPDQKLDQQILKMRGFSASHTPEPSDYRLNPEVFYLKFVKRDGLIRDGAIITPLEHFERLRDDPVCRGPRKGMRVSYRSLSGRYLRQKPFLDLVRAGYIGAYAETTDQIRVLVQGVLEGDRALVAAIERGAEARARRDGRDRKTADDPAEGSYE